MEEYRRSKCGNISLSLEGQVLADRMVETAMSYMDELSDVMDKIEGLSKEEIVRCVEDGEDVVRELREEGLLEEFIEAMDGKGAFTIPDNLLEGPNSEMYEHFIEIGIGRSD